MIRFLRTTAQNIGTDIDQCLSFLTYDCVWADINDQSVCPSNCRLCKRVVIVGR